MKIGVMIEKCTGCGLCENMCSLAHTGVVDRRRSAVNVLLDELGESIHHPRVCRRCAKMPCLAAERKAGEPVDVDAEQAKFAWDALDRAEACPFDGCFVYNGRVYHCDLCGGDPACVKVCTSGALTVETE